MEVQVEGRVIAWSLGNFLTASRLASMREGALLKVGIVDDANGGPKAAALASLHILIDTAHPKRCWVRPIEVRRV